MALPSVHILKNIAFISKTMVLSFSGNLQESDAALLSQKQAGRRISC